MGEDLLVEAERLLGVTSPESFDKDAKLLWCFEYACLVVSKGGPIEVVGLYGQLKRAIQDRMRQ